VVSFLSDVASRGISDALQAIGLGAVGVQEAFQISVAEFIFQRWMLELGKRIEERAVTAQQARKLELEAKAYVNEAVKLDLHGKDVITTDWRARENQTIVENIYREAYHFLEVST